MADHDLIDGYLADLARRLPPEVVDELADGLEETVRHHLATGRPRPAGLDPPAAMAAAIDDFGRPAQVAAAFARQSTGGRTAVAMLSTAPICAILWGTALIGAGAWDWSFPRGLAVLFGVALVAIAGTLLVVATSKNPARTRLAGPASAVLILLDLSMLITILTVQPALTTALAFAFPASLVRIAVSTRNLPRVLAR